MKRFALALLTLLALGTGGQAIAADDDTSAASEDTAAAPNKPAMETETPAEPPAAESASDTMPTPADGDSK